MKNKLYLLFVTLFVTNVNVFGVMDTLRQYNPNTVNNNYYYNSATYTSQYAYFATKAPGFINKITLTLGGNAPNKSVTIHIYGQEGGEPFPEIKKDLVTPLVFTKTTSGIEKVTVTLPTPVWVDNNQFFLEATNFTSTSLRLLRDNGVYTPYCSSSSGGNYNYIYLYTPTASYYDTHAFAIDVIMDCPNGTTSPSYFQDVTASSGVGSHGSRNICWGDFNNDHYLDLLASGRLFKNNRNGTFTDITTSAGINSPSEITSFIDINNDGKEDIIYLGDTTTAFPSALYLNNGDETFTKLPLDFSFSPLLMTVLSIGIVDVNNDKYPDLWVSQYEGSVLASSFPHYLFINDHNNGFTDGSNMIYPNGYTYKPTRGSAWTDFNNDNQLDLYVANYRLEPDEFWKNNGNSTFTDIASAKGLDINSQGGSGHGTGADWADYDNDGDMDLLLCQLAHPSYTVQYDHRPTTIYQNTGAPNYNFVDLNPGVEAGGTGIQFEETHAGGAWGDLNNDGLQDFFISAFYGCRYSDVYLQKPDHSFELKSFEFGVQNLSTAADATIIDFDNDGRLDLVCGVNDANIILYKNNIPLNNNWVAFDLNSTSGNYFGIGAKVVVYAGGNIYTQMQIPFHGANVSKGNRLFFGLDQALIIDSVNVQWPNGVINAEKFCVPNVNNVYTLIENSGGVASPLIYASGNTNICPGSSVSLNTNNSSALTYQWKFNEINITNANTSSYTANQSGVYSIQISNGGSCTAISNSITVTVVPFPPVPTITLHGDTLVSSSTTGNQWYNSTSAISGEISQTYFPTTSDYYYVIVTVDDCSSLQSNTISVITGIKQTNFVYEDFTIYPNPVKNELTVETPNNSSKQHIVIENIMGQTVFSSAIQNKVIVDVSTFTTGIYLIKLNTEKSTTIKRFIKE